MERREREGGHTRVGHGARGWHGEGAREEEGEEGSCEGEGEQGRRGRVGVMLELSVTRLG